MSVKPTVRYRPVYLYDFGMRKLFFHTEGFSSLSLTVCTVLSVSHGNRAVYLSYICTILSTCLTSLHFCLLVCVTDSQAHDAAAIERRCGEEPCSEGRNHY